MALPLVPHPDSTDLELSKLETWVWSEEAAGAASRPRRGLTLESWRRSAERRSGRMKFSGERETASDLQSEVTLMFLEGVAIGHASQVIADGAMQTVAPDAWAGLFANLA